MSLRLLREHIALIVDELLAEAPATKGTSGTAPTTPAGKESPDPKAQGKDPQDEKKKSPAQKNAEKAVVLAQKPPVGTVLNKALSSGEPDDAVARIPKNFLAAATQIAQKKGKKLNFQKIKQNMKRDINDYAKEMTAAEKAQRDMKSKGMDTNKPSPDIIKKTSDDAFRAAGVEPGKTK